ncbi:MAG: sulfotransferase domain-containing protein [Planctomycetota bacterium]
MSEIVERAGVGERQPWCMPEEFGAIAPELDSSPELFVFKTHVCKHPMRERLLDGRAIGVSVHRDIRDVVVSGAQKAGADPDESYCRDLVEGVLASLRGWPETEAILETSYERLTTETAACCLEIARHLGVPLAPSAATALAAEFSPARQAERIERALEEGTMRPAVPGGSISHMDRELLHPNHIADGRNGKWREALPDASLRVIEDLAGEWMLSKGYRLAAA